MLTAQEQFNKIIEHRRKFRNKIIIQSIIFVIGFIILAYRYSI